jgi:tetratricopeptide (TPR) repeat protein
MRTTLFLFLAACLAAGSVPARAAQEPITEAQPFEPLRASKDIEVGTFYMKKGNYEAAIDRFEEATRLQPGLAEPYLKLGETYEKMKDLPSAVRSYQKYLQVFPTSPQFKKIRKRIDDLERRMARQSATKKDG